MRVISYSQAIAEAQLQEMQRDEKVILLGLVLRDPYGGAFGQTRGITSKLGPDRVFDLPVSENGYVGAGVGAAMTGMRPVVELQFSDFITVAMDQVVQQAANLRYMSGGQIEVPMVLRAPTGAYLSAAAQHSHSLESWFAFIPGIKVVLPSDACDAKGLLTAAIRDDNPVLFLEHKKLYASTMAVPEEPYEIALGAAVVRRPGTDVSVVAWSYMVGKAMEAADAASAEGISVEVIDLRTVSPLDETTVLESVRRTGRLVVVQEAYRHCSVATSVAALVAERCFAYLRAPIRIVAARPAPIPFAPVLENELLPQTGDITTAVRECFRAKRGCPWPRQ